ncbi:MAG: hypothetical protein WCG80_06825 [Spirochaetales bacterium]
MDSREKFELFHDFHRDQYFLGQVAKVRKKLETTYAFVIEHGPPKAMGVAPEALWQLKSQEALIFLLIDIYIFNLQGTISRHRKEASREPGGPHLGVPIDSYGLLQSAIQQLWAEQTDDLSDDDFIFSDVIFTAFGAEVLDTN